MGSKEDKRAFYESTTFILPPNPKFRQFRLLFKPRKWVTVPFSITCEKDLREYCINELPDAVYFMSSAFNNAKNIGRKFGGRRTQAYDPIACNCFLSTISKELFFDFDVEDFGDSMTNTYKEVFKLYADIGNKFDDIKFVFSGRGFHVWVLDFYEKFFTEQQKEMLFWMKPYVRERYVFHAKRRYANELHDKGHVFDIGITYDTRRILRVPGSYNEKSLQKVTLFNSLPMDFLRKYETHTFSVSIASDGGETASVAGSFPSRNSHRMMQASQKQKSPGYRETLGMASPKHAGSPFITESTSLPADSLGRAPNQLGKEGMRNGNT